MLFKSIRKISDVEAMKDVKGGRDGIGAMPWGKLFMIGPGWVVPIGK
jgi:hypothetical protein